MTNYDRILLLAGIALIYIYTLVPGWLALLLSIGYLFVVVDAIVHDY